MTKTIGDSHKGMMIFYYLGILDLIGISHPSWGEIVNNPESLDEWYKRSSKFRWPENDVCPECGRHA